MDSHDEDTRAQESLKVRELNDQLRRDMPHGRVMMTRAVAALDPAIVFAIVKKIRRFSAFTPDNDPWGEHDFGQIEVGDKNFYWKIDAYDLNLEFASPDPTDDTVTKRILTIMTPFDL